MESVVKCRKGLDLPLAGRPAAEVTDLPAPALLGVHPAEIPGLRARLLVKEGDVVQRGAPLLEDKRNTAFRVVAPAGGRILRITYGPRRVIEEVVIERSAVEEAVRFSPVPENALPNLKRETVMTRLLETGFLALLRQRPYAVFPNPAVTPKAIFVNGMDLAPFHPDFAVALKGHEAAFRAGLAVLTRLTSGKVHLCLQAGTPAAGAAQGVAGVETHFFSGPHPAGNTSVHIHHIDPIQPGDHVWTIKADDVLFLAPLFLKGELPATRLVALGGPGVREEARRHYRVRLGAPLASLLEGRTTDGELRVVAGDALAGTAVPAGGFLRLGTRSLTVLREDRERRFHGWMFPGIGSWSCSPLFLTGWGFGRGTPRAMGTNQHGGHRAMVVTGLYDRYLPMRILPEVLVRAILAREWDEALALGLLEIEPEDFALMAYVCPSKTDLVGLVRQGLDEAEAEGV